LQRNLSGTPQITPDLVTELDRRLDISTRYGISPNRLRSYLQRLKARECQELGMETDPPSSDELTGQVWGEKVRAHRRRQVSVAAILDETFGQFAKCSPDLWEHRAYLMLVGLVYERLATNEDELSTDELVTLSKVLAANRRAEAQRQPDRLPDDPTRPASPPAGELPDRFADAVRQVYGTNLDAASA
jgi:hypothetical protein